MNPRLQIAAMCLQGIISNPNYMIGQENFWPKKAKIALEIADALIEQEKATRPKEIKLGTLEEDGCAECDGLGIRGSTECLACNGTGVER